MTFQEAEDAERLAANTAKQYLLSQMVSGKILLDSVSVNSDEERLVLYGQYVCLEMIGRERSEEIIKHHG
jgi:hypothetical protein